MPRSTNISGAPKWWYFKSAFPSLFIYWTAPFIKLPSIYHSALQCYSLCKKSCPVAADCFGVEVASLNINGMLFYNLVPFSMRGPLSWELFCFCFSVHFFLLQSGSFGHQSQQESWRKGTKLPQSVRCHTEACLPVYQTKIKCCSAHVSFSSSVSPVHGRRDHTLIWSEIRGSRVGGLRCICLSCPVVLHLRYALNSWSGSTPTSDVFSLNCVQISSSLRMLATLKWPNSMNFGWGSLGAWKFVFGDLILGNWT